MKIRRYNLTLIFIGQRYKGKFICNGNETNIRECNVSYQPVTQCDKGDLLLYCDESMYQEMYCMDIRTHTHAHAHTFHWDIRVYRMVCYLCRAT